MKAISLWLPTAAFVCMGWKTIETRTHARFKGLVGQRIAIHATQKVEAAALLNEYLPMMGPLQVENFVRFVGMSRGKILCTTIVAAARWAPNVDFVEREEWNKKAMCEVAGKYCLFLEDIKPLRDRVPFTGRQGIFNVPDSVISAGSNERSERA